MSRPRKWHTTICIRHPLPVLCHRKPHQLEQLVSHVEGNGPSVPHRDQREFFQDGWDWFNIYHLLVVLELIEHGPSQQWVLVLLALSNQHDKRYAIYQLCHHAKYSFYACYATWLRAGCLMPLYCSNTQTYAQSCCLLRPWRQMKRAAGLTEQHCIHSQLKGGYRCSRW